LRNDLLDFGGKFAEATQQEQENLAKAIADSYKTTQAKIILNFGKTVIPVYKAELEALKLTKINDGCNMECATKCYEPDFDNNDFRFNKDCMKACKCSFKFEKKTPEQIQEKISNI